MMSSADCAKSGLRSERSRNSVVIFAVSGYKARNEEIAALARGQ